MAFKSIKFLFITIFASVSFNANAIVITETLTGTVNSGEFAGTVGTGSFSYDDTFVITGNETLNSASSLTLEFTIFGELFTHDNDIDFPIFPKLTFSAGTPVELDFYRWDGFLGDGILLPGVDNFWIRDISPSTGGGIDILAVGGGFEAVVGVNTEPPAAVPIPAAVWLLGSGLIGLFGFAKRKAKTLA